LPSATRRDLYLAFANSIHLIAAVVESRDPYSARHQLPVTRLWTAIGWEITSRFEWPWRVAEMVHQHHERMDGTGYPLRLRDEVILLEARIIAVADAYGAASTRRPFLWVLDTGSPSRSRGRGSEATADLGFPVPCLYGPG